MANRPPDPEAPRALAANISKVVVGKDEVVLRLVAALLAGGHALLEDVPGTGKTVLARALAKSIEGRFRRVQFTPDLLPSDLTGVSIYSQRTGEFDFRPGPVFAEVLLADELNRATPRTQSALLEAMEERTVSVDGETHALPPLFFAIATQNPVEQQGVYELPEAQLDRFLVRLSLGYATIEEEKRIILLQRERHPLEDLEPACAVDDILAARARIRESVAVEPNVVDYIVRLAAASRSHKELLLGASARASIALHRVCQARAWLDGEPFVTPDRVKAMAPSVMAHRFILRPQSRLAGTTAEQVVASLLASVEPPIGRMA